MEIIYLPKADEDLMYWIKSGQKNILKKIALITSDILEHPYTGIAKPEALKYNLLENDLISNKTQSLQTTEGLAPLNYKLFENDALVLKKLNSNSILLKENNLPLLNFSFKDFPNFGIWTKINAPFICLEPWVGYADTIDAKGNILEKEGIQVLEPKKNDTFTFTISIL